MIPRKQHSVDKIIINDTIRTEAHQALTLENLEEVMPKQTLVSRLAAALCDTDTVYTVENPLEYDPLDHKVIGKLNGSEIGLFKLLASLKSEIGAEQIVFDRTKKHSPEEKSSRLKLGILEDFYDQVDDLVTLSIFERHCSGRTATFITGILSDGTIVEIKDSDEMGDNPEQEPEKRTMQ